MTQWADVFVSRAVIWKIGIVTNTWHIVFFPLQWKKCVPTVFQGSVWRSGILMSFLACLFCCFLHASHFPTMYSITLFMPCQDTVPLDLLLHVSIPRCPSCSFYSTSSLRLCGMTIWSSLSNTAFATLSSELTWPYFRHFGGVLSQFAAPWLQQCPHLFCFDLSSDTGKDSIMFTWCSTSFLVVLFTMVCESGMSTHIAMK